MFQVCEILCNACMCTAGSVFFCYVCSRISALVPPGPRDAFLEVTLKVITVHVLKTPCDMCCMYACTCSLDLRRVASLHHRSPADSTVAVGCSLAPEARCWGWGSPA